ncbi:RBBP8 N-terminal-like protein isoform X2 [Gadus morhua]|uniref:RBBP8 N-terminal-like protein isoform X2 n=1 Tax=Gadus morhua TaxID=8049 RepID=UPI0011B4BE65|nr:RBBP8 N-terminal-like protein isoform X2 [Gadus morhua]
MFLWLFLVTHIYIGLPKLFLSTESGGRPEYTVSGMDSFNELLYKLRDVHERELEGWQLRVQELSNKKGCDIKRMEELFNRNQQMKEQQRTLTENIKTLENRLRAGLCDRCTVTQEVAKRRQQEYESSQIQTLHQFSILVGEMNNLKKENRRLREELGNQRKAMDQSNHLSNITATEVKPSRSPDHSTTAVPVALTSTTLSNASKPPEGGNVAVKTEADQKFEDAQVGASSRKPFESYNALAVTSLEHSPRVSEESRNAGDKRLQGAEGRHSPTSNPPQHKVFLQNLPAPLSSSSSPPGGAPSRHVLHAPMPCRPRPIKSGALPFPWSVSEHSDWAGLAASTALRGLGVQLNPLKSNPFLFADVGPAGPQASPSNQGGPPALQAGPRSACAQQSSTSEPLAELRPRLFRVRSLSELGDSQAIALERKEIAPIQWRSTGTSQPRGGVGEGESEGNDGPLDLSERGRSQSNESASSERPVLTQGAEGAVKGSESRTISSPHGPPSSSGVPATHSSTPACQALEKSSDHCNYMEEEPGQSEEKNQRKVDQTIKEDFPLFNSSMQPVVLLGTLNAALHKQGTAFSNGKLKQVDPVSSSEEQDKEGRTGGDQSPASKRARSSTDKHSSRESETEDLKSHKRLKI